ncbi:molybdenum cofactor guanylyltransferase [Halohasta salina]|uniref:molybdenum cofactor guanylyltransferase n=1 Tax=Halohasta salina TaxID=2961621 RepID=UPI0020A35D67|nr:molybdenum cofactor guanylyltransferase [Halohasta salina]
MTDRPRSGVVLAGGYSTRFEGADKALATVDGRPMLARVVDRLAGVVDRLVVSCRTDQQPAFETALAGVTDTPVAFVHDPEPDGGPLAGLAASCGAVETTYAAVVACDMPFLDPAFVSFLFERAAGHDAAIPELEGGHLQPTQAVYRANRLEAVATRQLAADRRSLHGALDEIDTVVIPASTVAAHTDWRSLRDVNSRADLEAL